MLALTAVGTSSAWNAGGSLLTFYFPIGLFVVISALLCLQFGRPHPIPGSKPLVLARTSAHSAGSGQVTQDHAVSAAADGLPPAADAAEAGASEAEG